MEQYIPKSALVAKIKKRKDICKKVVWDLRTQENKDYYQGKVETYSEIAELIDTLEVKEVELEREINDYFITVDLCEGEKITENTFRNIAEHFFELGMQVSNKVQKGE